MSRSVAYYTLLNYTSPVAVRVIGGWLETVLGGDAQFGISSLVLSGVLRVVTHPRVFARPTPIETAGVRGVAAWQPELCGGGAGTAPLDQPAEIGAFISRPQA